MDRTERCSLVAASIVVLIAVSAVVVAAAPVSTGGPGHGPSTLSRSPAAFAEAVTARRAPGLGWRESLQDAIGLIVVATACALGVAFYSAVAAEREGTPVPVRIRRR
jgi:cation transport ATPase